MDHSQIFLLLTGLLAMASVFVTGMPTANRTNTSEAESNPGDCRNPSEGYMKLKLMENFLFESKNGNVDDDVDVDEVIPSMMHHESSSSIGTDEPVTENRDVDERSYVCPPVYNINYSIARYPDVISEVTHCKCSSCRAFPPRSDHTDTSPHRPRWGSCQVIRRPITVLQRTGSCKDGVYEYAATQIEVGVACACSLKTRFQHVQPSE